MALCRSHAALAVCVPGDARAMVAAGRRSADDALLVDGDRLRADIRYARLSGSQRFGSSAAVADRCLSGSRRFSSAGARRADRAVTLEMVMKKEKDVKRLPPKLAPASARPSSAAVVDEPSFHVVVMKVAIHCQGCAGKVKKHISKMEGVTSFSIDLDAKRVTVMGHLSPATVLESISKVKKAEIWPCTNSC